MHMTRAVFAAAIAAMLAIPAFADTIRVGVTISATGPAASLGVPQRNTIALMPREIAGQAVAYTVLDDAGDTTRGVANMRKLIEEDRADVIIGSSTTPVSLAMIDVAAEKRVPMISLAASARLIAPMDAARRWVFKVPQNDTLMADAVVAHMAAGGVRTIGFIGFNDAMGDGFSAEITRAAKEKGLTIAASERFARTDGSVTAQVLKLMAAHPDAVFIAASGTPAALPQRALRERGYTGKVYQNHGVANADFLRVGGRDVEGTVLPAGPVLVAAQLDPGNPVKQTALGYIARYEAAHGVGSVSTFGAHAWDAGLLLSAALPDALAKARPGTAEFRAALRDAMEARRDLVMTHGVASMSPTDHNGFDTRARVMVTIRDGTWKLLP
jgi:branched-chain amino acid transport system substrate-binding protein